MLVLDRHKYRDIPERLVEPGALGLFVPVQSKPPEVGQAGLWYDHSSPNHWICTAGEHVQPTKPQSLPVVVTQSEPVEQYPGWHRVKLEQTNG